MSITKEVKNEIILKYQTKENDTGSPEVQCAILTHNIKSLTEHMKAGPKDFQSRRGLIAMVNRRKSLLSYLKKTSKNRYDILIEKLGLRR